MGAGDYTDRFGGTSAATAIVSGVAALVWARYPGLDADTLSAILQQSARRSAPDIHLRPPDSFIAAKSRSAGSGLIDAHAALILARQQSTVVVNPSTSGIVTTATSTDSVDKISPVFELRSESYVFRGQQRELKPSSKWFVLWKATGRAWADVAVVNASKQVFEHEVVELGATQGFGIYLLPRSLLVTQPEVERLGREPYIGAMYPAYKSGTTIAAPLGTVEVILHTAGDAVVEKVTTLLSKAGLGPPARKSATRFTIEWKPQSTFRSPFTLSRTVATIEGIQDAYPEFAWMPSR